MNLFYKWLRVLALVVVPLLVACASTAGEGTVGTSLSGVGHYGGMTGIPNFYVNGQWGGNAPGWGGGGGKSLLRELASSSRQTRDGDGEVGNL